MREKALACAFRRKGWTGMGEEVEVQVEAEEKDEEVEDDADEKEEEQGDGVDGSAVGVALGSR